MAGYQIGKPIKLVALRMLSVVVHCAGDFGGYFGLLLGGSALSIFEIIDLIIYNAIVKFTTRKIKPNQPRVINVKGVELEKF